MRESFYAVLLLSLLIRRSRRNLQRVGPLLSVRGLRPSSNAKTPVYGSVLPVGQIGSRKAWEPVLRESV